MTLFAQGKYWLDREGSLISLGPLDSGHDEWAWTHGTTLEILLESGGWVRIQYIPPLYVYIDHRLPASLPQLTTLKAMMDLAACRIVVEYDGRVLIDTTDPLEALKHVVFETH